VAALLLAACLAVPALLAGGYWLHDRWQEPSPAPKEIVRRADLKTRQTAHALQVARIAERWHKGEVETLWPALNELRPAAGEEDLRGFAWHYLYERGRAVRRLPQPPREILALQFSADGRSWFLADRGARVERWDAATDRPEETWEVSAGARLHHARFTADGNRLAGNTMANPDGREQLFVWDRAGRRTLMGPASKQFHAVVASPDGRMVAYGTNHGSLKEPRYEVRLWDTDTGADRMLRPTADISLTHLCFSPDGRTLALSYVALQKPDDGRPPAPVELWDVAAGQRRWQALVNYYALVTLAFSADGRELATGGWDGGVYFLDTASGPYLRHFNAASVVDLVCFSPDGKVLAVAAHPGDREGPGTVSLWMVAEARKLEPVLQTEAKAQVYVLTFAPDGRSLRVLESTGRLHRPGRWPSPRTARPWPRPATGARCGSGTPTPSRSGRGSRATAPWSAAWRTTPTAAWSPGATISG
jgi:WD40 repeat protein